MLCEEKRAGEVWHFDDVKAAGLRVSASHVSREVNLTTERLDSFSSVLLQPANLLPQLKLH